MMRILFIFLLFLFVYGCETTTVQPEIPSTPDARAIELFDSGEFLQAGREYMELSESFPVQAVTYKLWAAYAFIKAADFQNASGVLNSITTTQTDSLNSTFRSLLVARLEIENDSPGRTLELLENVDTQSLTSDLVEFLYTARASAHEKLNHNYVAATEFVKLDNYLISSGRLPENTHAIWKNLIAANLDSIGDLGDLSVNNLVAWLELTNITRSLITRNDEYKGTIEVWQQLNPSHPANENLIPQLLQISNNYNSTPGQVALLLPLTGIYETYSEKIRDGFLTAWFNERSYKPVIKIYNTDNNDIVQIYNLAVQEGAEFIVGPLDKDAVARLSEMETIPARTLALNQIEVTIDPEKQDLLVPLHRLVQFGLPPEDEARQVAQRGIVEGFNRALVVTSNDEFGNRVFNAFSEEWTGMGGKVLEKVEYHPRTTDYVTPIKQLLNIDSSDTRFTNLRQKLGRNIIYNSRLREDAEFIFVVANNLTARQIVPHLRFFRAEGVPIYSISAIYTGKQNPQVDSDLNGVEFVDIPWLFEDDSSQNNIAEQIQKSWEADSSEFPRYYAFGVDAFRLISRVGELMLKNGFRYQGETGQLFITRDGKIRRKLLWARFNNGVPLPLSTGNTP